jgi:hypothetical protein
MFDVAGLDGEHDILQYVKPNALAKDLQLMMECTTKGVPKQCMMYFPVVYSGEMMWDMLKSAICKTSEEQGYTLRSIQCDKSTVSTKSAMSGIAVIGWTYSLGCVRCRLYQSLQTMRSFVKNGDNHMFAKGNIRIALLSTNIICTAFVLVVNHCINVIVVTFRLWSNYRTTTPTRMVRINCS